jgi:hypothetical protein
MDKFREAREKAIKHIKAADHILTQTYPHIKDPKLLIAVLDNIHIGIDETMSAILHYLRFQKKIGAFHDSFATKLDLIQTLLDREKLTKEEIIAIKTVHETIEHRKKSAVEFSRKDSFVISSDSYDLKVISQDTLKKYLKDAKSKRADHLIYVSLKYTRTVDVIKNVIERLINAFDFGIMHLLEMKKEEGAIEEIPASVIEKMNSVKEFYKTEEVSELMEFYSFMRALSKAKFTRQREFRRHVTMSAFIPEKGVVEVTIDTIHEYYEKSKKFIKICEGKEEE